LAGPLAGTGPIHLSLYGADRDEQVSQLLQRLLEILQAVLR
jgi:hypothetical protein